jgi:Flp pilus assembly protein TadG
MANLPRFASADAGSAVIEYAIIAPLFIGLLISVLETGIYFLAQNNLQAAAIQAGRLFLTGQVQSAGWTESQVIQKVCPTIQALFTCSNVMMDVQTASTFNAADTTMPTLTYNSKGQVSNTWNYNGGTAGSIVVLRLIYQWPIVTGPFALIVPNLTNGTSEIMGVTAFRVEPYG